MRTDGTGETQQKTIIKPLRGHLMEEYYSYRETKSNSDGEGFSAKLWSIDLTGYNERQVNIETDASDPSWSSLSPISKYIVNFLIFSVDFLS